MSPNSRTIHLGIMELKNRACVAKLVRTPVLFRKTC